MTQNCRCEADMGSWHFSVTTEVEPQLGCGGGGHRPMNGSDFGGDDGSRRSRIPESTYQTGTWLFIFAVTMMFAGLTSTIVVRQSAGLDWVHTYVPPVLYFNTLILLASSVTFELARRSGRRKLVHRNTAALYATVGLG